LMSYESANKFADLDYEDQTVLNLLFEAFRKEHQHYLGEEAKKTLYKPQLPPLEDESKNILDVLSSAIIFLNALVIGVSSDMHPDSDVWWGIEICFTAFFTCEMLYNWRAAGTRRFFLGETWAWNTFDVIVVGIALSDLAFTGTYRALSAGDDAGDTGSFTIIKMARLGRLARLVRVLRFKIFNELKSMIQGVLAGLRVLFWAIMLFFFFIYLVGVVMRKTVGDSERPDHEYARTRSFETVPISMLTLFRCFTDGCVTYDGTPLHSHLYEYYGFSFMLGYMLIYMFVTIGIFNLIMAIFIDNVMEASIQRKKEELGANAERMEYKLKELIEKFSTKMSRSEQAEVRPTRVLDAINDVVMDALMTAEAKHDMLASQSRRVGASLALLAEEEDLVISKEVFAAWLDEPDMVDLLAELDIAVANKNELFDALDSDLSGELEVPELITGLMRLRGPADKSDAVAALLGVRHNTKVIEEMSEVLKALKGRVSRLLPGRAVDELAQ